MRVDLYVFKVSNVRYESRFVCFVFVLKRTIDTFAVGDAVARIVTETVPGAEESCMYGGEHFRILLSSQYSFHPITRNVG